MNEDPDPYYDFWMPYEFKHPSGHSMRLFLALQKAKTSLQKQGKLGQLTMKYMAKCETR